MNLDDPDQPWLDKQEIAELRQAIAALRRQLESGFEQRTGAADSLGDDLRGAGRRLLDRATEDPIALLRELGRHLSLLPARASSADVDEFGLDAAAVERARPLLDFLLERWWRASISGLDLVPADERVMVVANRSGVLPWDGLMLSHVLARHFAQRPRFLVADWLVHLPFVQSRLAALGGVRACAENARDLLKSGRCVIAFPEGQKGALKLFHDRYRLQRFARGGFVSIALRENAVIVPAAVVGAEETYPVLYESGFVSRLLGAPALVTPTFPLLGPLGAVPLPSRWHIRFGEPMRFDAVDPALADDPLWVNRMTEQVRGRVQRLIDAEVRRRKSVFS